MERLGRLYAATGSRLVEAAWDDNSRPPTAT